jgi:hypothetical protein
MRGNSAGNLIPDKKTGRYNKQNNINIPGDLGLFSHYAICGNNSDVVLLFLLQEFFKADISHEVPGGLRTEYIIMGIYSGH